jgi:hypothetical protein
MNLQVRSENVAVMGRRRCPAGKHACEYLYDSATRFGRGYLFNVLERGSDIPMRVR